MYVKLFDIRKYIVLSSFVSCDGLHTLLPKMDCFTMQFMVFIRPR